MCRRLAESHLSQCTSSRVYPAHTSCRSPISCALSWSAQSLAHPIGMGAWATESWNSLGQRALTWLCLLSQTLMATTPQDSASEWPQRSHQDEAEFLPTSAKMQGLKLSLLPVYLQVTSKSPVNQNKIRKSCSSCSVLALHQWGTHQDLFSSKKKGPCVWKLSLNENIPMD